MERETHVYSCGELGEDVFIERVSPSQPFGSIGTRMASIGPRVTS